VIKAEMSLVLYFGSTASPLPLPITKGENMKYRKKPIIIEASQWFKLGDQLDVVSVEEAKWALADTTWYSYGSKVCLRCDNPTSAHGWIGTLEGGHRVCPGDWIITGVQGERYPCKPDIFEQTYEKV